MIPQRKKPARGATNTRGNRSVIIFVTVCTRERKNILARDDIHDVLRTLWRDRSQWVVGRYMIMPDHIHLFSSPAIRDAVHVRDWIAYWKSKSALQWPRKSEAPVWQREAWDRQVRAGESYTEKWNYVKNNPVRAGLVHDASQWPFQGEIEALSWHDE
jgi:putative transposase